MQMCIYIFMQHYCKVMEEIHLTRSSIDERCVSSFRLYLMTVVVDDGRCNAVRRTAIQNRRHFSKPALSRLSTTMMMMVLIFPPLCEALLFLLYSFIFFSMCKTISFLFSIVSFRDSSVCSHQRQLVSFFLSVASPDLVDSIGRFVSLVFNLYDRWFKSHKAWIPEDDSDENLATSIEKHFQARSNMSFSSVVIDA